MKHTIHTRETFTNPTPYESDGFNKVEQIRQRLHTNLTDSIETTHTPDRTNNIIIGIAVGVMITLCAVIFVVASFIQNVI